MGNATNDFGRKEGRALNPNGVWRAELTPSLLAVIKATSEQLTSFTFTKQLSRRNISVSLAADSEKLNRLTQPHSLVTITQRNALANRLASWLGYIHHIRHTDAHFINSLSYAVRLQ